MGDGDGGPVIVAATMGVTYLFAEFLATALVASAMAIFLGILIVALTLVWVIRNPIPTLKGWAIFLAGGTTLLILPVLAVYAIMGGRSSVSNTLGAGADIGLFLCALWLIADFGLVAGLYNNCAEPSAPLKRG